MIPQKQLTLADIFEDCNEIFDSDKPQFLSLLENHIDLDEIVPLSFRNHFFPTTRRHRKYPLNAMLWVLIIQRIFSIPTDSLLLVFLNYSRHLREFCVFSKVPDASKITHFKQDFISDLHAVLDKLVDITEPICRGIDENLDSMIIFDTSRILNFKKLSFPLKLNCHLIMQVTLSVKTVFHVALMIRHFL